MIVVYVMQGWLTGLWESLELASRIAVSQGIYIYIYILLGLSGLLLLLLLSLCDYVLLVLVCVTNNPDNTYLILGLPAEADFFIRLGLQLGSELCVPAMLSCFTLVNTK